MRGIQGIKGKVSKNEIVCKLRTIKSRFHTRISPCAAASAGENLAQVGQRLEQPGRVTDAKRRARIPHKPQKDGDQMPQSEKSEKKKKPTQKEKVSLLYKGVIALAAVVGILLQCEIGKRLSSILSL